METIRINKYLSEVGFCSRRSADSLVEAGRVKINSVLAVAGQKIDPKKDTVLVDNEPVGGQEEKVYYVVNKPKGVISTSSDEKGRKSVVDLVPKTPRVYPVGRLDRDSEGLLVLTNDGDLTNILTHPKNNHVKRYEVLVQASKAIELKEIEDSFVRGMKIGGIKMSADRAEASVVNPVKKMYKLKLELHTGYNRQVRKMCAKIGLEVIGLQRVGIAKLSLDTLVIGLGKYKKIAKEQII